MSDWVILSKWLPQLIYPYNVVLWLLLCALVLFKCNRPRVAWSAVLLATIVLGLCSSLLSTILYRQHEQTYLPISLENTPKAGAIVLLAGDVGIPLRPRINSQIGGNRVLHAFRLYQSGKAPLIVITGGNVFPQANVKSEAFYTRNILRSWGVHETAINLDQTSRNTYENAINTAKLLDDLKVGTILLVTSAFHMPRAVATFRHTGLEVIPSPSGYSIAAYKRPMILDWWPTLKNMNKAQSLVHEIIGIQIYRVRGWID